MADKKYKLTLGLSDGTEKSVIFPVPQGGGTQADFAQNDSTQPDYVKNRTHYKYEVTRHPLFIGDVEFKYSMASVSNIDTTKIVEGEQYEVTWNGTVYNCVGKRAAGEVMVGNLALLYQGDDTGEPFCIEVFSGNGISVIKNTETAETVAMKIVIPAGVRIKKLDKEYLPDDIGGGSGISVTAQVGQTTRVKAVDAKGIPTEWEAVDYQEKICGSVIGVTDTLTFDGNMDGREVVDVSSISAIFVKMSDTYVESSTLIGSTVTAVTPDGSVSVPIGEDVIYGTEEFIGISGYMAADCVIGIPQDGEVDGNPIKKGTYFLLAADGMMYASELKAPSAVFTAETIQTIPPKYLPEALQFGEDIPFEPITWDGNTEGMETYTRGDYTYVRIGDYLPADKVKEAELTVTGFAINIVHPVSVGEHAWLYQAEGKDEHIFALVAAENERGIEQLRAAIGVAFPSPGLWIAKTILLNGSTVYVSSLIAHNAVKTIDKKYLPSALRFGEEVTIGELLPETSVTFDDGQASFPVDSTFVGDEIYTVKWGSSEYNTKATNLNGMVGFGNLYAYSGGQIGENTGEPFVMIFMEGELLVMPLDDSTEQTVSIMGATTVVNPMDAKYLPNVADLPAEWLAELKTALGIA